jgi:hypothetical protein
LEREAKFLRICNGDEYDDLRVGVDDLGDPMTFSSFNLEADIMRMSNFKNAAAGSRQKIQNLKCFSERFVLN